MDNNKMFELNDEELDQVSGGKVYINANNNKLVFSTTNAVYTFKNCTYRDVRDVCEDLIGKYATEAEYDAACEAALKAKGWI
ncbi:MAG: bacteriocin [Bacillota bacterium]|nr:bacteriocin [Bacillota bacterium]